MGEGLKRAFAAARATQKGFSKAWIVYQDGRVQWWYDRSLKSWVVRTIDGKGDQIGEADYDGNILSRDCSIKSRGGFPNSGKRI